MKKLLIIFLLTISLVGCKGEEKQKCKYLVWKGTGVVSVGLCTDHFEEVDGMLVFINKINGKENRVPLTNISSVEEK